MDTTPPWIRDALRFALTATASTPAPWFQHEYDAFKAVGGGDLVDPDDPGKDPRFRKLVEAILFSRRFMNTYNLLLVGVLLVFTIWHWGEKFVLRRRRQGAETRKKNDDAGSAGDSEAWSSSSSTIEGSATPPESTVVKKANDADESSPLLPSQRPQHPNAGIWRPYFVLKAALQYQPPRIPIIRKTLPTNAVSLFVLVWVGLIIFYNLYRMPLTFTYLFVFADRCGIVFITNLPLLYLLAAKNQPIKLLTGYSYESLNIFHRRVGEVMCLEAFLHFLGMVAVWYGMLRHLGFTLARFLLNRVVLLGLAAFIAYELIYFTSLGSFRQRWYEIFLGLHIVLQVAGLVFLWFHHHTSRPYVGISLAIFLIDRLVYRLWLKSSTHPATLTVLEDDKTLLLSANWEVLPKRLAPAPTNMKQGWNPNEHVFISVPALSRKHAIQSHPFTIFSAAPTSKQDPQGTHAWFTLLIRAQAESGFTHTLLQHARLTPQIRIRLDGPYGSSHALDMLQASSTAILIAGGSGIAVAYPLLYSLLCPASSADPETATAKGKKRNVRLLWITHAPNHCLWIPEDKLKELRDWGLDVLIPPPTSLAGRPDAAKILREWVESETSWGGRAGVVVSGPDGLVRDVRNECAGLIFKGRNVDVQVEKFGW
ncbi:ferric reductase transmembrane component [Stemphylium lycopersici]|uniref:Ferric reductase transmembrane component n=1 Tax=Stemphylium lycopersici TaxID=183478 RepID=A0A364MSH8_STELY|nr:ferric reductase transmembrane component [Stemphylium lycopersici]RAR00886.1 ferric reductase transmembrane component [Stemphylium lycopersici]RAR07864.1 ferric reductase transmembrane component [Stemphylium lycopersici]